MVAAQNMVQTLLFHGNFMQLLLTPIFSKTQYNRGRTLVHMIKHVFNVAKITLIHLLPTEQLLPFCLVGQYRDFMTFALYVLIML